MTPRIFKDAALQSQFDKDGYVVIPLLNGEDVKALTNLFYELHPQNPVEPFYSTTFNKDEGFKQIVTERAGKIFDPVVGNYFEHFKKLGSSFLSKAPGEQGKMPVHQDWTVVDESKFYSATIWVPLVNTTEGNGAMRVLPGSHKFSNTLRAPTLPGEYAGVNEAIWNAMQTIPMQAGEALIFNHALLHASSVNTTGKERLAITYGLIPEQASLLLYHLNQNNKLEKYNMPNDMFQRYYNIGERPLFGDKVDEFNYSIKPVKGLKLHHFMAKSTRERNMTPLFKDPEVQNFFETEGYVKLPVLSETDIKELLDFYTSLGLKTEGGYGFNISMDGTDKEVISKITKKIFDLAMPKASIHFQNAKPFVTSFVVKEPNPLSVLPVHQDWSFVEDENRHCSVTCWIPLVDTNLENGALGVVRGSHKFFSNFRPSPAPQVPSPISEHMFTIFPYLKLVEMKAGEALIFDNRTFHGSPSNTSVGPRVAFGIGFTQSDAKLVHYNLKPDGNKDTVFKYNIDPEFFEKYNNTMLSKMYDKGELIEGYPVEKELPYVLPVVNAEELVELIKEAGNEFNVPMCEKLALLYSYNMDGSKKSESAPEEAPKAEEKPEQIESPVETPWVDDRTFFQKYTPINIVREIKKKLQAA